MEAGPPEDPPSYDAISGSAVLPRIYSSPPLPAGGETLKGVPLGLQDLLQINQLNIQERFSVSQGDERNFDILDDRGQRIYQANQQVECCCPTFDLKIRDNRGEEVMEIIEGNCCTCSQQVSVVLPAVGSIGSVNVPTNAFITQLSIMNASKEVILLILGPSLKISAFGNIAFEVKSRDEQHVVGMIRSEGNQYAITFPMDLEVTMKAMLLASCFYLESLINHQKKVIANRSSDN